MFKKITAYYVEKGLQGDKSESRKTNEMEIVIFYLRDEGSLNYGGTDDTREWIWDIYWK